MGPGSGKGNQAPAPGSGKGNQAPASLYQQEHSEHLHEFFFNLLSKLLFEELST